MADQMKQVAKVNQLRPLDAGLNLTVKVIDAKMVAQRGRNQGRFSECLVGDETGIIIFSARNDQGKHPITILSCNFRDYVSKTLPSLEFMMYCFVMAITCL